MKKIILVLTIIALSFSFLSVSGSEEYHHEGVVKIIDADKKDSKPFSFRYGLLDLKKMKSIDEWDLWFDSKKLFANNESLNDDFKGCKGSIVEIGEGTSLYRKLPSTGGKASYHINDLKYDYVYGVIGCDGKPKGSFYLVGVDIEKREESIKLYVSSYYKEE